MDAPGYLEGLEQAGAIPIVLPLPEDLDDLPQLVSLCDGLLFTGGQDVSPALYGETPKPTCGEICPARDRMEQALLHLALERDLPVLGICRGIQFLNAVLGGTLYQDLPTEHPSQTQHHMTPPYDRAGAHRDHSARHPSGGAARDGAHRCEQLPPPGGEDPGALPDRNGLVGGPGLIEAVCLPEKRFVWAVQWHPEFAFRVDEHSRKIFGAFVAAARGER